MHHALFLLLGKQCQFMRETILKRNANLFVVILKLCYNMMKAVSKNNSRLLCWVGWKYPSMVEIWSQIQALAEAGYLVFAGVKLLHIRFFRPKNCYKLLQNSVKLFADISTCATTNNRKHFEDSFWLQSVQYHFEWSCEKWLSWKSWNSQHGH